MSELFLIATIAGKAVAILSDQVESVVDIDTVTPIPRAAPHILGLAALRSRVVTVIDSTAALGLTGENDRRRGVITCADGHHYAIMVDALDDVMPLARQPLANGVALDPAWSAAACGVVERDGEPVLIVDVAALVAGPAVAAM